MVQKGLHLPNEGREASSYLWYIKEHYDNLCGLYEFRQAKEHEHLVNAFKDTVSADLKGCYVAHKCSGNLETILINGVPYCYIGSARWLSKLINLEIPDILIFSFGAQFDVTAEQIKLRSKEWYENAYQVAMREPQSPWIFERLWKYIFNL